METGKNNKNCFYNIGNSRFRSNIAANNLLLSAGEFLFCNKTRHKLLWILLEEMALCIANSLSRHLCSQICFKGKLYTVTHLTCRLQQVHLLLQTFLFRFE